MTEHNESVSEVSSEALNQSTGDTAANIENGESENASGEGAKDSKGPTPSAPNEMKLYVGNLPDNCSREDLQTLFSKYGEVSQCDRVKNFAFVHMVGEEHARKAISALDDSVFMGTHLQVQIAKSKGKPAEDECFQCGSRGHWAKDCTQRRSGPYRRSGYSRYDRPAPYSYGPRRDPYSRGPPPRDYDYYYDRRGPPSRDYGGAPPYRSRSPVGYGRRSPDYSMGYEGYGPPRSGYGVRRY